MRAKLFFGAATAAVLMFTPGALAQQADPPGDANTTARFSGEAIESELSPAGDTDWYRMTLQQGLRYSFTLDALGEAETAIDPMLAIYDTQGNQLALNDDANGTLNSALSYTPTATGEVFVEVRAFFDQGSGPYRLAATSAEVPPDDAGNDANTRARAAPGRAITGNLEYAGDTDWYRLSVRPGQRYRITLAGAEGAQEPVGDPLLRVLDRDGNELAVNDDDGETLNSAVDYVPQTRGDVFIEARAYADAYTGTYTLNVAAASAPTDGISANRNTRGRISLGGDVDGVIDFPGDVDWYRIRLEEGQSYRFTLTSAGGEGLGDPLIRIRNANGDELAMDDDGGDGFNSYLEFTAPSTGNYFVEANAFGEASTGGYTIGARTGDMPGDVSTDATLAAEGDYREGVLSPAGDRDWYRVTLGEGQAVRVSLTSAMGNGEPLGDPYLALYGPDGAQIAYDDDGGDGLNSWLEFQAPAAGAYYVEARGFSEDAAGRYAISLIAGEVGDTMDGAEYLTPGPEGRASIIGQSGDADWFAVEMIEGRPYRFTLDGAGENPLADPLLTLYDAQGNSVAQDDDGGAGFNAYLTFASPTGGTYFAAVTAFDGSSTGEYLLRATDTDVPGHVYTDEVLDGAGDERVSRIDMEGDLDYFQAVLEAGVRYTIEVRGHGDHPLTDPFLAIMDGENNRITSDDDSGPGLDAHLTFTPEMSGNYFIQASGLGGSMGWYKVSIVRQ